MIPKIIHYCWFGGKEKPEEVKMCMESWKKYCPDYEIKEWNESNYDIEKIPYVKQAYEKKKYAFVSDYARLDVIYNYGGIYLDTDVELVKSLDVFLDKVAFFGCELIGKVNTGIGFGAEPKNKLLKENMDLYLKHNFIENGIINTTTCVEYTTNVFKRYGLKEDLTVQQIEDGYVYPPEYFCPYNLETNKMNITKNTHAIHHYSATWKDGSEYKKYLDRIILLPLKIKLKRRIDRIFGEGTYRKLKDKIYKFCRKG